jgi:multidrug efflux pump subunit AcrA (membrane-fusion protein)
MHKFLPIAVVLLALCTPARAEAEAEPGKPFETDVVLAPEHEIKTASPAAGIVAELLAKEGSPVRKGDPLLQLDDEQARLTVERSAAVRNKLRGDYDTAQRLFEE